MIRNPELRAVAHQLRQYYFVAGFFSLAVNLLYLAGPIYMLQVYDRVMSSGSVTTLVMLSLILLLAYLCLVGLDIVRGRILSRAGIRMDTLLSQRLLLASLERPEARSQPLRDLDTIRQFATGGGIQALFDLPWVPLYLIVLFLLHPLLGMFALCGGVVIGAMAFINELVLRKALSEAGDASNRNYAFTDVTLRNAESVNAMGMAHNLILRWSDDRNLMLHRQLLAGDRGGFIGGVIKFVRMSMQSIVLGLGAFLVIERMATAGIMFAGSMLLGRALQPIEQVVAHWRSFVSARDAYARIDKLLAAVPAERPGILLPRPTGTLCVENVVFAASAKKPILKGVSFRVEAGEAMGVIGPSGAGKSTLARLLMGVAMPSAGAVRLDGANIAQWPKSRLGRYLGYMPQDIELFPDTIAANICRFEAGEDHMVVEAAKMAGVHDLILQLPQGYDTRIGAGGAILSGGTRQRIGLARAVYGLPNLVVLDEPSSNLDTVGDLALGECLRHLKEHGRTVVVISHRAATIAAVDKLLVLKDGLVEAFGERDDLMRRFRSPQANGRPNIKVIHVNQPALSSIGGGE
ncbi:type I secretion system permease/ATPase [Rhizobium mesoamericanum]|uniref:type I secretion system permease/ATPase n=1 Tax=Rhizobium mesoamericanum TaxID=1079800 RepID=UPI00040B3F02|nr:type I secretion system permease/ATPase [Rhizobium mesoamericanum]